MAQSKIFKGNRALGYVSNHIPLVTRYIERRKENLIVTCTGRTFHTYGCTHFTLLSVSGVHASDITCLSSDTYHVYTASSCDIYAWRRGTELKHTYKGHQYPVHGILAFGPLLISVDEESNLFIWDIKSEQIISEHNFNNNIFKITTLIHPSTYINKILLGSEQGHLELWNIDTGKMIYLFEGWNSSVTALEQAPALDVVAVGLANGKIILHNIKKDVMIFELMQDWGLVTAISFRSDDTNNHPVMATGTLAGHIVFWNLEDRKVDSQRLNAHFGAVAGLKYLPNEPLIVSSSPDNSLKLWICDTADDGARLLRIREGHAEPPTFMRFYGDDGSNILSAGGDSSLRIFSTVTEIFNKSLGRASFNRKASKRKGKTVHDNLIMSPITSFATEKTREKEWDNIIASHLGLGVATTWSYDKLKMGQHKLIPKRFLNNYSANASALCLTQCGNFVIIGYSTGHIDRFNIQSGIHRATYGINGKEGHKGPVKGVAVDPLNQFVMSGGRDATIKFWPFKPAKDLVAITTITLTESVKWFRIHRESSLVAVGLEDFTVILIDIDTRRVVRRFQGHTGHLTDATFNPDARWLITASMDCTIRTWDIPSAQLVDVFKVPEACISLDFSPTGEYLATIHMSNSGIYLWSNCTLFNHVSLKAVQANNSIPTIDLPGVSMDSNDDSNNCNNNDDEEKENYVSPDQLDSNLITMSALANSRWQNLLNIDIIKKKNKPHNQDINRSAQVPFFLPTIAALDLQFDLSNVEKSDDNSKLLISSSFNNLTVFSKLLQDTIKSDNYIPVIDKLKSMSPSAIDFEIQSLSLNSTYFVELTLQFLKMIKYMMGTKQDFELGQVYLGVLLKKNSSKIQDEDKLVKFLLELRDYQLKNWCNLREKLFYNISVVKYLKKCN